MKEFIINSNVMKINTISKYLFLVIYLLLSFRLDAQDIIADTIKVKAGKLSEQLGNNKDLIKYLTLKGEINGTDITTIRSMAKLSVLNMADAKIVKGGVFVSSIYDDKIEVANNEVPEEMLYGKDNITSVVLPEDITAIGTKSFSDCSKLTVIIIPDGVTSIGTNAFIGCTKLESVTFSKNMAMIDYAAFQDCTGLTKIYCRSLIPAKITPYTFFGVSKVNCKLYVPQGTSGTYKAATGWSEFKNIIEEQ
jgi:hypothetical protein